MYLKLKSLNMVFLTNNICEKIHQKISNCFPHSSVTKTYFRDTLSYVLKQYSFKIAKLSEKIILQELL